MYSPGEGLTSLRGRSPMAGSLSLWAVNILEEDAEVAGLCTHCSVVPKHRCLDPGKALPVFHGSEALVPHMAVPTSIDVISSLHIDSGLPLVATGVPNQPGLQGKMG